MILDHKGKLKKTSRSSSSELMERKGPVKIPKNINPKSQKTLGSQYVIGLSKEKNSSRKVEWRSGLIRKKRKWDR